MSAPTRMPDIDVLAVGESAFTNNIGTDTVAGQTDDCIDRENPILWPVTLAAAAGGSGNSIDIHVEESDDASTWIDIEGVTLTFEQSESPTVKMLTFSRKKRYLRAVAERDGGTVWALNSCFIGMRKSL